MSSVCVELPWSLTPDSYWFCLQLLPLPIKWGDVVTKHVQQWLKPSYHISCKHPDVLSLSVEAIIVASPIFSLPQLQDMLYTMDDSVVMGVVSLTLLRCDLSILFDCNAVLMSQSLHTLWILSLNPALYGIVRIKPFSCSDSEQSLEGNSWRPALIVVLS